MLPEPVGATTTLPKDVRMLPVLTSKTTVRTFESDGTSEALSNSCGVPNGDQTPGADQFPVPAPPMYVRVIANALIEQLACPTTTPATARIARASGHECCAPSERYA
jgi:hypothetical protein